MKKIAVLLADDHAIVREGLRSMLESNEEFEVVGEASNGRQAVNLALRLCPAVVVMDICMPLLNGIEATRQILQEATGVRVLALSGHSEDYYVERMVSVGASGYVVKQNSRAHVVHAIKEIAGGHPYFSPSISKRLEAAGRKARENGTSLGRPQCPLTSRETEVLQLVAEGAANKQIAAELGISIKTVEKHRQHLMEKLNIHHIAGLTRHALAEGIIENGGLLMTA